MNKKILFFCLSSLLITSCSWRNIHDIQTINVPNELNLHETKLAIKNAIYDNSRRNRWFLVSTNKNSIIAGYDSGKYDFNVEYIINHKIIEPRIISSHNLRQTTNYIHKRFHQLMGRMRARIKKSMGKELALKNKN